MPFEYHAPILTVDTVIFRLIDNKLNILLIQRDNEPFKGKWALPGGYNAAQDTTMQAVERVLLSKVGVLPSELTYIEQLYTFDTVTRDPRGHTISVTYLGLTNRLEPNPSETTQHPIYFPVDELPELAYDHAEIVAYAIKRLQSKLTQTTIIYALMPENFTLTQLQRAYEVTLGRTLDKRNFRKQFLAFDKLESTDRYLQEGAHRPALLYHFKDQTLQDLQRSF